MSARSAKYGGTRRPQCALTTPERNRRLLRDCAPDDAVRAHLRAGIEEFRRMLEGRRAQA